MRYTVVAALLVGLPLLLVLPALAQTGQDFRPDTTWVLTFDHDFYNWADPHIQTFEFPPAGLPWSQILLFYRIECPGAPGDCDPWDRLGHLRVVVPDSTGGETHYEIARIITPYDITGAVTPATASGFSMSATTRLCCRAASPCATTSRAGSGDSADGS